MLIKINLRLDKRQKSEVSNFDRKSPMERLNYLDNIKSAENKMKLQHLNSFGCLSKEEQIFQNREYNQRDNSETKGENTIHDLIPGN